MSSPDSETPAWLAPLRPHVVLVGAGPGDPELITVGGDRWLREADVVLYDYLVNPLLLKACRTGAELICLGKHGRDRLLTQDEVNDRMVREARRGRLVVRLKGGDPAVFARFGDETAALEAAGLRYRVVPGITTALAVGSHAAVPLTDRRAASAVALITGHEQTDQAEAKLDYRGLAAFPGTLVFYMGVVQAPAWTRALIAAGKPATTPTAVVRRCSWPDQQTIVTTLGEAADAIQSLKLRPPVIVVVGPVVDLRSTTSWFTSRPLFGRRVLVTRPEAEESPLAAKFRELGADVVAQPAIEIGEPDDPQPLDAALRSLERFEWLVFSSGNGVRAALGRLLRLGADLRALRNVKLAAIGPGTAEALRGFHLHADLIPPTYRAEALAEALVEQVRRGARSFLLVRASRGREVLAESLRAAGAEVTQIVAYSSRDVVAPDAEIAALVAAGKIDWITVTSSAIARSVAAMFGPAAARCRLASISPITSQALRESGLEPAVEATTYTFDGLIEAVLRAEQAGETSS